MRELERIVACTDFSAPGDRALEAACDLAGRKTRLLVIHVIEPMPPAPAPLYAPVLPPPSLWGLNPEQRDRIRNELLRRVRCEADARVIIGEPVSEILRVAEEERAELLVVGTHGRRGAERFFLGSVAEKIVRRAHCWVLVAH